MKNISEIMFRWCLTYEAVYIYFAPSCSGQPGSVCQTRPLGCKTSFIPKLTQRICNLTQRSIKFDLLIHVNIKITQINGNLSLKCQSQSFTCMRTANRSKTYEQNKLSRVVRKPAFCICENKGADQLRSNGADQLRSNCAADQRLCFRYTDSRLPLLPKSEFQASSHIQ